MTLRGTLLAGAALMLPGAALAVDPPRPGAPLERTAAMGGTRARAAADHADGHPAPADFLAAGQTEAALASGAMDAQPALQAAAATGAGWVPCGTYRLDRALAAGAADRFSLTGAGAGCVRLRANFAAGDIVRLLGTHDATLAHLVIEAGVQRTSGAVIHLSGTYRATVDGVPFEGPHGGDGYLVDAGANTTSLKEVDCRPPVAFVIGTFGAGACVHGTGDFADLRVSGRVNAASWHYGVQLTNGSGFYADALDAVMSGNAMLVDPSAAAGERVFGVTMTAAYLDTSLGDNLLVAGDGPVSDVKFNALWTSNSQTANGVATTNPRLNGMQVGLLDTLLNHGHGAALLAGRGIDMTNVHAEGNSTRGPGQADGIFIGPDVPEIMLGMVRSGQGGTPEAVLLKPPSQRWGIFAPGGPAGQVITIIGAQTRGNLLGGISLPANAAPNTVTVLGATGH